MNSRDLAFAIRQKAQSLGFADCGFSKAEFLAGEQSRLEYWLKNGFHAGMKYMENNLDKRLDPTQLMEGAKTVISLTFNYAPDEKLIPRNPFFVARFALGKDYHDVLKEKLFLLAQFINESAGNAPYRVFTDSAPVLERAWAVKSGLGWIGKNACLIVKNKGSFFLLAEIITAHEIDTGDQIPVKSHCGSCRKCIDNCPTGAITDAYTIDARRCISYLTTEFRENFIPAEFRPSFQNHIFGCDICQEVCPWNNFCISNSNNDLMPDPQLALMKEEDWINLNETAFQEIFRLSGIKRIKYEGLMRNIRFVKK